MSARIYGSGWPFGSASYVGLAHMGLQHTASAAVINFAVWFEWLRGEHPKDVWVSPFLALAIPT